MFRTVGERTSMRTPDAGQGDSRRTTHRSSRTSAKRRYPSMMVGDLRTPMATPKTKARPAPITSRSANRAIQLKIDTPFLLSVLTLVVFGLVMVYSASYDYSRTWYGDSTTIFNRQLMWLGLGILALVAMSFIDYHYLRLFAVPALITTGLMLIVVLFAGEQRNGAVRSFFGGSIQPSELAKIVVVLYLSVWLYSKREDLGSISFGLLPLMIILGTLSGLILLQPDLSAAITIIMLGGLLFFLAGGDMRQIVLLGTGAIVVGFLIVYFNPTGSSRLSDYLAGLKDPTQGSYHVRRAFGAFANGGWFGVGLGEADAKLTGLPVAPTDSIFAVIGEETGVFGATALVLLYIVLLWRGLTIARRAPDPMGALLASGLSLWIVLEAFINMAVMINLLPFAGNALPFISAGGSSLVSTLAAVGIIMNVSRLSEASASRSLSDGGNGGLFHAVVNLRRRDGRRRVSGAGGAANVRRPATTGRPAAADSQRTQRP